MAKDRAEATTKQSDANELTDFLTVQYGQACTLFTLKCTAALHPRDTIVAGFLYF